jgi:hypothetical protein
MLVLYGAACMLVSCCSVALFADSAGLFTNCAALLVMLRSV